MMNIKIYYLQCLAMALFVSVVCSCSSSKSEQEVCDDDCCASTEVEEVTDDVISRTTSNGKNEVDDAIAEVLSKVSLPLNTNNGMFWTGMKRQGDYLVYTYSVDGEYIDIHAIESNFKTGRETMKKMLAVDPIYEIVKRNKMGFKLIYRDDSLGEECCCTLKNDEL